VEEHPQLLPTPPPLAARAAFTCALLSWMTEAGPALVHCSMRSEAGPWLKGMPL